MLQIREEVASRVVLAWCGPEQGKGELGLSFPQWEAHRGWSSTGAGNSPWKADRRAETSAPPLMSRTPLSKLRNPPEPQLPHLDSEADAQPHGSVGGI